MEPRRAQRVSETLREELSELIAYELNDPRLLSVDVTEVLVAPDMKKAVVRASLHGSAEEREVALEALNHARHFLRRQISKRVQLFRTPELFFEADVILASGSKMENLLKRIRKGRPREDEKNPVE